MLALSSIAGLASALFPREQQWFLRDPFLRLLNDPLVWGTAGGVLGGYLFVRGFLLLQRKRLLANTPRSTVRAAALGPVEISGELTGPYTLVAPLSLSDCYYYRIVTTHVKGRRRARRSLEECAPLFVNDGTGELMLDPRGAQIQFPPKATDDSGSPPDYLCRVLTQHGISTGDVARVEEYCMGPADKVVVFGTLQENPWARPGTNWHDTAERVGPGFLSEVAADVQRRQAFESLDAKAPSGASLATARHFDLYPPVLLAKGTAPFFISHGSERELVDSLGWQSALYIWGGPMLTLFCVYFLLQRLAGLGLR